MNIPEFQFDQFDGGRGPLQLIAEASCLQIPPGLPPERIVVIDGVARITCQRTAYGGADFFTYIPLGSNAGGRLMLRRGMTVTIFND